MEICRCSNRISFYKRREYIIFWIVIFGKRVEIETCKGIVFICIYNVFFSKEIFKNCYEFVM